MKIDGFDSFVLKQNRCWLKTVNHFLLFPPFKLQPVARNGWTMLMEPG
jgi:hypothetical protein